MINAAQFVNGIWMGVVLIALGLLPALFENLTDSAQKFIGLFMPAPIPSRWRTQMRQVPHKQHPWLTALGATIIGATFFLYFGI
jgi:hypothetical protein